ncbi:uncharacterized protein LOC131945194 [Physella acuta]|uniref:uncharacterized protein LOC131945194 n=1 Tax=Physella acuta TaxID=109671 RepID=UPI0027DB5FCB|nr:uncharacterized protein LOC131945194 [Physella acuta]
MGSVGVFVWSVVCLTVLNLHLAACGDETICADNHWTSGNHPHPLYCDRYVQCSGTTTQVIHCTPNTGFDPSTAHCVTNAPACNDAPVTVDTSSGICRDNNWQSGVHPHPDTCDQYIMCYDFATQILNCQAGLKFDPTKGACVAANIAEPCNDHTGSGGLCRKADILFIIDSSSSIGYSNYSKQLEFVRRMTTFFPLDADNVRFSVIVFATDAVLAIRFNDFYDHMSLTRAIQNLTYVGAATNTYKALQLAQSSAFTKANGARDGVPHITVVLTDGMSSDYGLTVNEASRLRSMGVIVLAVGIAAANRTELEGMTGYRGSEANKFVFYVENFDLLHTLQDDVPLATCQAVTGAACLDISVADIILVMDSSSSIGYSNYQKQLTFAANLTDNYNIGESAVKFGAISYGTEIVKIFDLKDHQNHAAIRQSLLGSQYLSSSTNTAGALQKIVTDNMFGPASGGRNNVTKVVITMTDGESNNVAQTKAEAQQLKAKGYKMISIGIGSQVNHDELTTLATSTNEMFLSPGYDVLHMLNEDILTRSCGVPGNIPITVTTGEVWDICRQQNWVNGIHANPFDCTKFIECTYLHTAIMNCPAGLLYDPSLNTCTFANSVSVSCLGYGYNPALGVGGSVIITQTTPATNFDVQNTCRINNWNTGIYTHPYDCRYYIECHSYTTQVVPCPLNFLYDPTVKRCEDPSYAHPCNDYSPGVVSTTNFYPTVGPQPVDYILNVCSTHRLSDGLYPDPGSCSHFVECVNQITYHMECPDGLHFNTHALNCDDVHLVNCNDNYRYVF